MIELERIDPTSVAAWRCKASSGYVLSYLRPEYCLV